MHKKQTNLCPEGPTEELQVPASPDQVGEALYLFNPRGITSPPLNAWNSNMRAWATAVRRVIKGILQCKSSTPRPLVQDEFFLCGQYRDKWTLKGGTCVSAPGRATVGLQLLQAMQTLTTLNPSYLLNVPTPNGAGPFMPATWGWFGRPA